MMCCKCNYKIENKCTLFLANFCLMRQLLSKNQQFLSNKAYVNAVTNFEPAK